MSDCDFSNGPCPVCGFSPSRPDLRRNCTATKPPGLGDYVAAGLSAVGITKERVAAVVGPCGCSERQAALNEWGARTLGIGRVDPPT